MRIHRLGDVIDKWAATFGGACLLATVGCAHHRADQYAYAPPYAPPVYPQPPVQMPVQPAAPTVSTPGPPVAALPAGGMVAGTTPPGMVMQAVGGECPPCVDTADACTDAGQSVVLSSGMMPSAAVDQTPPCPPGP